MRKTFETQGPIAVVVRLPAGELGVQSLDTTETVVELEPENGAAEMILDKVTIELEESRLLVTVPERLGPLGRRAEFGVKVRCPLGSSLEARTASADVHSTGRLAELDVRTASGDVQAEESEGETRISSASGDVTLGTSGGPIEVGTASGDVDIGMAAAGLRANLVSGDLHVRGVHGGAQITTVSGDLELDAVGPGSIRAKTVSGDVQIGVKPGCDVWMDVKTLSGDTSSELESCDGPPADRSGLVELEISTTSGDVHIDRAPGATAG